MNELREHPVATLVTAGIFILFILFFATIVSVAFYAVGWTEDVFEGTKWVMGAVLITTFFGLVAAVFEVILGVRDRDET